MCDLRPGFRRLLPAWCLLAVVNLTAGDDPVPPPPDPRILGSIQQDEPSFLVRAAADREDCIYYEGDSLRIRVQSEVDSYVYVLYQQMDGKVVQIFPSAKQPQNKVAGKQVVVIPDADDSFRWEIGPPFGKEQIKVIASQEPIAELSKDAFRQKRFNPVSNRELKDVVSELQRKGGPKWAESLLPISTVSGSRPAPKTTSRRFGVFFGVSNYEFSAEHAERGNKPMNLACCHRDAEQLGRAFKAAGRFDEVRVFPNSQATRRNLEVAVTEWLPSVTQSGDMAVIYFSGHGSQIPDDDGDEADGLDEILLPYDYVTSSALIALRDRAKAGTLDQKLAPRVAELLKRIDEAETNDAARQMLARATGVTDDLFGHWLQRLDGRQAVVILDICHAGGFASDEKELVSDPAKAPVFDFLDGEMSRLKDIDQKESVLFAACYAAQTSSIKAEHDLSVMTDALLQALQAAPGKLEVKQALQDSRARMEQYFRVTNARLQAAGSKPLTPHQPYLVDYCTKPVYLKP